MDRTVTESIRRILAECAGEERPSLTLGIKRSTPGVRYYFTPPEEPRLQKLLDALSASYGQSREELPEGLMMQTYEMKKARQDLNKPLLARTDEEEDCLRVRFYAVNAMKLYRSYGWKIAAGPQIGTKPVLELSIDAGWNVFVHNGSKTEPLAFNWWFNKCLRKSWKIRRFVLGLIRLRTEAWPVMRDVADVIEQYGFLLPRVGFGELCACGSVGGVMEMLFHDEPEKLLPLDHGAYDINTAYYITCIASDFVEENREELTRLPQDMLRDAITLEDLYKGPQPEEFLTAYYRWLARNEKWETSTSPNTFGYVTMCDEMSEPLRLCHTPEEFDEEFGRLRRLCGCGENTPSAF